MRTLTFAAMLFAGATSVAQETLTLEDALRLAKERNGTIRSAQIDLRSAQSRVVQARAQLFPTVTPAFSYVSRRQEIETMAGRSDLSTERGTSNVLATWRLLDTGQRDLGVRASRRNEDAQRFTTLQTSRTVLFSVHEQYYEALRAQELQRVADSQVARADKIVEQTRARVEVGDAAAMDILRAEADAANARVQVLAARNRTAATAANLKATIGLEADQALPALVSVREKPIFEPPATLESSIQEGLDKRADLLSRRSRIESLRFSKDRSRRDAGLTFGIDAQFDQQVTPESLYSRSVIFSLSYPLFDGDLLRQQAREAGLLIDSSRADLLQAERTVRSEVESAYKEFVQNEERVEAANVALTAARASFDAAVESQRLGAADLIDVLTAQVSLVTAESNYIEAIYDYTISEVRLRLFTGRPIAGE